MPSRRLVACFADIRAAIALMKQWTVDAGGPRAGNLSQCAGAQRHRTANPCFERSGSPLTQA